jgi:hypothetical protein
MLLLGILSPVMQRVAKVTTVAPVVTQSLEKLVLQMVETLVMRAVQFPTPTPVSDYLQRRYSGQEPKLFFQAQRRMAAPRPVVVLLVGTLPSEPTTLTPQVAMPIPETLRTLMVVLLRTWPMTTVLSITTALVSDII